MNEHQQHEPEERTAEQVRDHWVNRRREKIYQEIARNRQGGHKVPTWVLAVVLVAILAAWAALIISS
jgi:hypothetical protein